MPSRPRRRKRRRRGILSLSYARRKPLRRFSVATTMRRQTRLYTVMPLPRRSVHDGPEIRVTCSKHPPMSLSLREQSCEKRKNRSESNRSSPYVFFFLAFKVVKMLKHNQQVPYRDRSPSPPPVNVIHIPSVTVSTPTPRSSLHRRNTSSSSSVGYIPITRSPPGLGNMYTRTLPATSAGVPIHSHARSLYTPNHFAVGEDDNEAYGEF